MEFLSYVTYFVKQLLSRYEISESNLGLVLESFAVDPVSGFVNTLKDISELRSSGLQFPVEIGILARDNPNDISDSLTATTVLKVKILRPKDGVVLTVANIRPRVLETRFGHYYNIFFRPPFNLSLLLRKPLTGLDK